MSTPTPIVADAAEPHGAATVLLNIVDRVTSTQHDVAVLLALFADRQPGKPFTLSKLAREGVVGVLYRISDDLGALKEFADEQRAAAPEGVR